MTDTRFKPGQIPWNKDKKGIHLSPESEFQKGMTPWNKGSHGAQEAWNKGLKYEQIQGEKHFAWKGDKVGYSAIHSWVRRKLGQPLLCSECGKTGGTTHNYHWANISHEYKRDLSDWERLCVSCHKVRDLLRLENINVG